MATATAARARIRLNLLASAGKTSGAAAPVRVAVIVIVAILLMFVTVLHGVVSATRNAAPAIAVRLWTNDAWATAAYAGTRLITDGQQAGVRQQVRGLAQDALLRDATVVPAARSLAVIAEAEGDSRGADRWLQYTLKLSRRDLPTQLLAIERAVAQGDVRRSLSFYDVALRTNPDSFDLLAPVLAQALDDDRLVPPIGAMLSRNPPWLGSFLDFAVRKQVAPENLARVLRYGRRDVFTLDMPLQAGLIGLLIERKKYNEALSHYNFLHATDPRVLVRHPNFVVEPTPMAFDWQLDPRVFSSSSPTGLSLSLPSSTSGAVISQLLLLSPADYALKVNYNVESSARNPGLSWKLRCVGGSQITELPIVSRARVASVSFRVPTDGSCPAQQLVLVLDEPLLTPLDLTLSNIGIVVQ